ncbi:MAG: hypothetical protein AB8G11_18660 [Saprospiraceae bacterium]
MKNCISLFLVIFLIIGCNDDEPASYVPQDLLLKKITLNGQIKQECEYYSDERVKKIVRYDDNGDFWFSEDITYSGDTTYTETFGVGNIPWYNFKSYWIDANQSTKIAYDENDELVYYNVYDYVGNECGYSLRISYDRNDDIRYRYEVDYLQGCDSYIEQTFPNSTDSIKYNYERDDKPYYGRSASIDIYFKGQNNWTNTIKSERFDNDDLDESRSYTSTFTYNQDNYPITEERTFVDGTIDNYTYEYY